MTTLEPKIMAIVERWSFIIGGFVLKIETEPYTYICNSGLCRQIVVIRMWSFDCTENDKWLLVSIKIEDFHHEVDCWFFANV